MSDFAGGTLADEFLLDIGEAPPPAQDEEQPATQQLAGPTLSLDLASASTLRTEARFRGTMTDMARLRDQNPGTAEEFALIARANALALECKEHQERVARFIKAIYALKFPELEKLVLDMLEYVRAVQCIGNQMDVTRVELESVLPGHTAMIVRIGASTTDGHPLTPEQLAAVLQGCAEALALEQARTDILAFIESRMSRVAPNLSLLVGTNVAAQLMTAAGGLEKLAGLHANAVRVLGTQQRALQGFSTKTQIQHVGVLQQAELVARCPDTVRAQAIRVLAGKCALAARVDSQAAGRSQDTTVGRQLLEEVEEKIERLVAPPPPRQIKALPVPRTGEGKVVKRGGEQARRKKAKYKMTELRKQQNRLAFGEVGEEGINDLMGSDLGLIGSTGAGTNGKLRVAVEDTGILKGLSKKRKMEIQRAMEPGQGSRTIGRASHLSIQSGMKSSLALEGDRGIELVDTTATSAPPASRDKYFGSSASAFGGAFLAPLPVVKKSKPGE